MYPCREITFATNEDGSINLQDIVAYNSTRPINDCRISGVAWISP